MDVQYVRELEMEVEALKDKLRVTEEMLEELEDKYDEITDLIVEAYKKI